MRFNNKELVAVAAQPSYKFDKEGILLLREKQEGLFRRSDVFQEKWFRLRGNLLFYYKNKDQYSEPAGVIVLEDCSVTLDSSTEVPFSFTLVFGGDENGQQLAAFSENERELWIQALHMASYEFIRSQLLSLKEKLETKLNQARLCSKERAKTLQCGGIEDVDDHHDPLVDEPNLELCLACDNLQCDADGQPPSPVVYIYTLTPPSIEWTKFAHTEVVQKCSNPTFSTTVGFLKSQIHMSTRVKLSVYHVRERVTATRILLGESVFTIGTLLQIKNSFMRLTLISPDCRSMGFISVMACELKSEAPAVFMNSRQTKSASPQDGSIWLKIDRPRSYSLPSCLSSRANCPLYAYLKILYHNLCSQTYRFHTGLGAEVRVHEIMAEPRLTFLVPQLLLNLWIKEEQKLVDVLLNLGQLRPEWHNNHTMAVDRHLQLINRYRESLEAILNKKNCYLKKSSQKTDLLLDFVPVNLHLQRLWAQNVTTRKTGVHDMITVGAFTAYSHDYKHGGLLRLLTQLKTTFPICNNGMPTGVLGPDPLSRAVEAIIRVEQLQSDMEVDLQQMLHFCSQRSASDMQTVVNSLSSKAKQLTLVCSAGLVEEALLAWEEVRPPEMVAPQRQNLAPLPNMFGALGQTLDNMEKSLYIGEKILNGSTKIECFEEQKMIRKFEEGSIPIRKCVTNSPDHICKTSLADCLPSPIGSPEEFEPLDLTHLNIKASIMCMSSKIQNVTLQQQQQPNVQNCWVAELVPSVRKLRQAMQGLCRSAKLTYGLLALKELPQHSTISQEIRHRRDAVFSQALTSVVTGIMTLLWCRPPDPFLLEQIIAAGLLIEFEGLLSCYSKDTGMLEDFVVAIDDLNRTNFWLESSTSKLPQPRVEGNRLFLSVVIPAPEPLMSMLSDAYSKSCRFTASCMLFNIGINEKATLAEKFGDVSLQEKINSNSLNHLREYFRRVSRCSMNSKMGKINASSVSNLLDKLQMEINSKKCKNVEILHLAAEICRRLGGIRFTSCKSAKDRTAMSVTLEQAIFLQKCFHLNNKEMLRALECMRSEGTRRDNTFKNVGVRKYAFNGLQLMALPKMYRPPIGTYGNVQT